MKFPNPFAPIAQLVDDVRFMRKCTGPIYRLLAGLLKENERMSQLIEELKTAVDAAVLKIKASANIDVDLAAAQTARDQAVVDANDLRVRLEEAEAELVDAKTQLRAALGG